MSPAEGAAPVKWTLWVPPTQCHVMASPALIVTEDGVKTSPPSPPPTVAGAAAAGAGPATASEARPAASARGVDAGGRMGVSSRDGGFFRGLLESGSGPDSVAL